MVSKNEDELRRVYDTLTKDIGLIFGRSKTLPQFKRRSFIRAFISLVEFDTYNRKQRALYLHNQGAYFFNDSELMLLREIQPEIDDKGKVKERQKFLRLIDNYRFAIRMFCKVVDIEFQLPVDDPGWAAFKDTVELRNRITHPKNEKDIMISDKQLRVVISAYKWFMHNYKRIVTLMNKRHFGQEGVA